MTHIITTTKVGSKSFQISYLKQLLKLIKSPETALETAFKQSLEQLSFRIEHLNANYIHHKPQDFEKLQKSFLK